MFSTEYVTYKATMVPIDLTTYSLSPSLTTYSLSPSLTTYSLSPSLHVWPSDFNALCCTLYYTLYYRQPEEATSSMTFLWCSLIALLL